MPKSRLTHAAVYDAIYVEFLKIGFEMAFQSTHPRGMRLTDAQRDAVDGIFQSTHPRGMRQRIFP